MQELLQKYSAGIGEYGARILPKALARFKSNTFCDIFSKC